MYKSHTLKILEILLDDRWHPTGYLANVAGKMISPEIASRSYSEKRGDIQAARYEIVRRSLQHLRKNKILESRGKPGEKLEWHLLDMEAARVILRKPPAAGPTTPMLADETASSYQLPEAISLSSAEFAILEEAKKDYEKLHADKVEWGTFLIILQAFARGGKLIR